MKPHFDNMRRKVELERWQLISFIVGVIFFIAGLIVIILWQKGFVQLKWLQCPKYKIPFT